MLVPCLIALSQGCGGCSSRPPGTSTEASTSAIPPNDGGGDDQEPLLGTGAFLPIVRFRVEGEPDVDNRYPSTVRITPKTPERVEGLRSCSGVIVSPHLVLTAGHCVCRRRQLSTPQGSVEHQVDGSSCVEAATVDVFFYEVDPLRPRSAAGHTSGQYLGRVRPHPRLEVRLSAQGDLLSSHADLAVIALDTPVPGGFRPVPVATTAVVLKESLVLVGFGYAEEQGWLDDTRLVNQRQVAAAMDEAGERFRLERQGAPFFKGDSGGPCFRESPQGPTLVGISTTGLGQEPTLTALHAYREWLHQEILRAEAAPAPSPGRGPLPDGSTLK
jgi:secreted trypsin-like serine protease